MLSRFFSTDAGCTHCGHSDGNRPRAVMPFGGTSSLWSWFDNHIARMEDDLVRNRTLFPTEAFPQINSMFDPQRRQRLFDALFTPADVTTPQFLENKTNNLLECELNTGCGDFFKPEDVEVNINGRNVEFRARREEKSDDGSSYSVREVRRLFTVPETADAERIEAQLAPNGKLMLTAPLNAPAIEYRRDGPIPIKINRK